jgi:cytochrome c5
MKYLFILVCAAVLIQCKSKKAIANAELSGKELAVAQKTWPSTTLEELKEGEAVYKNQCTQCHKNFTITKFSEKKWKHEIDDMSPKAKLTDVQKEKLSKYILSYREANAPVAK